MAVCKEGIVPQLSLQIKTIAPTDKMIVKDFEAELKDLAVNSALFPMCIIIHLEIQAPTAQKGAHTLLLTCHSEHKLDSLAYKLSVHRQIYYLKIFTLQAERIGFLPLKITKGKTDEQRPTDTHGSPTSQGVHLLYTSAGSCAPLGRLDGGGDRAGIRRSCSSRAGAAPRWVDVWAGGELRPGPKLSAVQLQGQRRHLLTSGRLSQVAAFGGRGVLRSRSGLLLPPPRPPRPSRAPGGFAPRTLPTGPAGGGRGRSAPGRALRGPHSSERRCWCLGGGLPWSEPVLAAPARSPCAGELAAASPRPSHLGVPAPGSTLSSQTRFDLKLHAVQTSGQDGEKARGSRLLSLRVFPGRSLTRTPGLGQCSKAVPRKARLRWGSWAARWAYQALRRNLATEDASPSSSERRPASSLRTSKGRSTGLGPGGSDPSPATVQAWYMDDSADNPPWLHHAEPVRPVGLEQLRGLGVLYWKLDANKYENDPQLEKIRKERNCSWMDIITIGGDKRPNYEEKIKMIYKEHLHLDDKIRVILDGSGYFDVRDKEDRWIRTIMEKGDMITLPAGIYHRFTLDEKKYEKATRLFVGDPVWMAYNRPADNFEARRQNLELLAQTA
ncbi:PREDICTED: uncharacterized protein LOC103076213 [Lipotes vexillifer]|uniref:Probable inactive acireductone dioxygenase n=1 Tax=Lipotes vexillifer TaxID=118797 RepID=A0A340XUJ4_LIPVE|nr:PREDICTED: uncharacterized protein LOC103076213 [Lipotes vexillifer]